MARLNTAPRHPHGLTHEGAPAAPMTAEQALRRSVMSTLLWESQFYEDGEEIGDRIVRLASALRPGVVAAVAVEARERGNLRHVPLVLLSVLAKIGRGDSIVATTIERVIQRADELTEFLAVHAKLNGVHPNAIKKTISAQMKKGIGRAFNKFDAYQISKYDRAGVVRLLDVMRLVHGKPMNDNQKVLRDHLKAGTLAPPDTWESNLVAGKDKRETFERLLRENRLGYLALLRNLRGMSQAGVDHDLIRDAIIARRGAYRVLPFRYVAAARAAPQFEPALDQALCEAVSEMPVLPGKTVVMVDVSGSMSDPLSAKSDLKRRDAASTLASIIHGDVRLFTFADVVTELPARRGMAGVDAISRVPSGGTRLFDAIATVNGAVKYDRIIVLTDEQAFGATRHGTMYERSNIAACPDPTGPHGYMINVASAQNGVGYGRWTHIDGFSESVLRFIHEKEATETEEAGGL